MNKTLYTPVAILDKNNQPTNYYKITIEIPMDSNEKKSKINKNAFNNFVDYLNKITSSIDNINRGYTNEYVDSKYDNQTENTTNKTTLAEIIAKKPKLLSEESFINRINHYYENHDKSYVIPKFALPYFFQPSDDIKADINGNIPVNTLGANLRNKDRFNALIIDFGVTQVLDGMGEIANADDFGFYNVNIEDKDKNKSYTFLTPDGKKLIDKKGKNIYFTKSDNSISTFKAVSDYFATDPYVFDLIEGEEKLFPTAFCLESFLNKNYPSMAVDSIKNVKYYEPLHLENQANYIYNEYQYGKYTEEEYNRLSHYYQNIHNHLFASKNNTLEK